MPNSIGEFNIQSRDRQGAVSEHEPHASKNAHSLTVVPLIPAPQITDHESRITQNPGGRTKALRRNVNATIRNGRAVPLAANDRPRKRMCHQAANHARAKEGLIEHAVRYMLGRGLVDQVMGSRSLNKEQAQLVEKNLHLVQSHLRRHVQCPSRPTRRREKDDLYQAGCLGLIEAARLYDIDRGIPFAAFAQRRIHHAVSRTAYEGFSTVKVPMRKQMEQDRQETTPPVVLSLEDDPPTRRPDERSDPSGDGTIAARLRQKYVSAVERARQIARCGRSRRGDRSLLVDRVVDDRLLIPDDEHKTSLRQIARDTESSYARVADCEKRIVAEIARLLVHDRECRRLRARARNSDQGLATRLDETSTDEQLAHRLRDALAALPATEATWALWQAVELTGGDPGLLLARLFARLNTKQQETVCEQLEDKVPSGCA